MSLLASVLVRQTVTLALFMAFTRKLPSDAGRLKAWASALSCLAALVLADLVFGRAGVPGLSIFERNALNILACVCVFSCCGVAMGRLPRRASLVWSMVFVATQQSAHKLYAYVAGPLLGVWAPWLAPPASDVVQGLAISVLGLAFALAASPTAREVREPGGVGAFQTLLLAFVLADCAVLVLQGEGGPFPAWQACTNAFQCLVPVVCALVIKGTVAYNCRLVDAGRAAGVARAEYARIEQKLRSDDEVRRMYHDLRATLSALHTADEVREIMGALDARRPLGRHYCDDPMLDMLLNEAAQACDSRGIRFEVETNMGDDCGMSGEDLCLVFGNALSNAFEALEAVTDPAARFIAFSAVLHPAMLVMTMRNGCAGSARLDGRTFLTTKEDRASHGIGLRSVRDVLSSYGGACQASLGDGVFTLVMGVPHPRRGGRAAAPASPGVTS